MAHSSNAQHALRSQGSFGQELPLLTSHVAEIAQPAGRVRGPFRVKLLINSGPSASVERVLRGRANRFGYFNPSLSEPIVLTGPGEYRVDITARYRDEQGVSWMGAVSWGSVVETPDSSLPADAWC